MHDPLQQAQPPAGQPPGYDPGFGAQGQQPYGVAPLVVEDGWGKIGVIMVALAVVFAGGVAFFIITSGGSKKEEAAAAALNEAADDAGASAPATDDAGAAAMVASADAAAGVADTETAEASGADAGSGESDPALAANPALNPSADVGGAIGLLRENGEVDRPAGLVSLAIESEPSGATVIRKRDGVRLGMTPYRYEIEASAGDVSFVLELDGYRSMSVSMPGNKDGVRQVMLLPGKGGVAIPAPQPAAAGSSKPAPKAVKPAPKAVKPAPKAVKPGPKAVKPAPTKAAAKTTARKPKRPSRPKAPSKPKRPSKPKKPKAGKVDYNADPIPL